MKLNEIIDQIKTLEGYVYHRLREREGNLKWAGWRVVGINVSKSLLTLVI